MVRSLHPYVTGGLHSCVADRRQLLQGRCYAQLACTRTPSFLQQRLPSTLQQRLLSGLQQRTPSGLQQRPPSALQQRTPSGLQQRPPSALQQRTPSGLQQRTHPLSCNSWSRSRTPSGLHTLARPLSSTLSRALRVRLAHQACGTWKSTAGIA
jgi:hypothetical protein